MNCLCSLCVVILLLVTAVNGSKLLFFLVDGFRWDYFKLNGVTLHGFDRLFRQGSRAKWLTPEFPTNSFPNYKTLETGLHVESHGVVGNYMFDEITGEHFRLTLDNPESYLIDWWNSSESFFVTAEKQGIRTALYYIRGCEIPIDNITPTFCLPYKDYPQREHTDWALQDALEKLKTDQTDVAYIYHQRVDEMGHMYGPNSDQVRQAVVEVDQHIGDILDTLDVNNLNDVDILVVSDHGMSSIDYLHKIDITEAIDMDDIREITEGGTQAYIWPKHGREKQVYDRLSTFHPHLNVYLRDEILERWFFKKHNRIPPIFITTDKGWSLMHPKSSDRYSEVSDYEWQGNHGFDNNDQDMRGIFAAYGPDFAKNKVVEGFDNVNVYQIICHVSGIKPRPNNGTWTVVEELLVNNRDEL